MKVACACCGWVSEEMRHDKGVTRCVRPCPNCGRKGTVFDLKEVQMEEQKLKAWTEAAK
jgi:hypothetical protein